MLPEGVEFRRHIEPFVGGGAFYFFRQPRRGVLCDVNADLIETYQAIQQNVTGVVDELRELAREHSSDFYYQVRDRYNRASARASETPRATRAAMFIYLNKTCFNGLHRVNREGHFNVPMGRYTNPRIVDEVGLQAASRALANAEIRCQSFDALLDIAKPNDFVYFDPPYEPVSPTANFTSYASQGFGRFDQERLYEVFEALDRRGCVLMLSNSDVPFIRQLYRRFSIATIAAPRLISCNAQSRTQVTEVVVRNYA
jgi:DNA adenine methylase